MIKTKEDTDYTLTVETVYNIISKKYGFTARITDIWNLLREAFMLEEFDILDAHTAMNGPLQAYLIEAQQKWQQGEGIDFKDIYDAILSTGQFTGTEKRMFVDGKIEERLWGIMLAVTKPGAMIIEKKIVY